MERVVSYIDGFNLYFGLRDSGWRDLLWVNLQTLSQNLLKRHQQLVFTKYFTARVAAPEDKRRRQLTYLEAIETLSECKIFYGKYRLDPRICPKCGYEDVVPSEKMTDVNIATELLSDAYQDMYDTALLISADSDLRAPVETVNHLFPSKRVVVAFPPNRFSKELMKVASAYFIIGRAKLKRSLFPEEVSKPDGYVLNKPEKWRRQDR